MVHQSNPTLNKWTTKLANWGAEMALFHKPSWAHQPVHPFQHCWSTLVIDAPMTFATAWQTEKENSCLYNTHLWTAKGLNAVMYPHLWWGPLQWDIYEKDLPTCWECFEAKGPPSNKALVELEVWIDLWHIDPGTWREPRELKLEEETHNSSDTSKDSGKHSTPRHPKGGDFPRWQQLNNVCWTYSNHGITQSNTLKSWNNTKQHLNWRCWPFTILSTKLLEVMLLHWFKNLRVTTCITRCKIADID